jgi:hypothetical protein
MIVFFIMGVGKGQDKGERELPKIKFLRLVGSEMKN